MVYLWHEKVKRNNEDPLTELLRLIGSSQDKCLEKEYVGAETVGNEAAGAETVGVETAGAENVGGEAARAQSVGAEAAPEQAGPSTSAPPTARPKPTVELLPCIYCSGTFKVK